MLRGDGCLRWYAVVLGVVVLSIGVKLGKDARAEVRERRLPSGGEGEDIQLIGV